MHQRGLFASPVACQHSLQTILQSFFLITMQFVSFTLSFIFLMDGFKRFRIHFKAWHILSLFSFSTESSVKPEDHTWDYISLLSLPCRLLVRKLCKELTPWNLSDLAYHMTGEHTFPMVMTSKNWQESHSAPSPSNYGSLTSILQGIIEFFKKLCLLWCHHNQRKKNQI